MNDSIRIILKSIFSISSLYFFCWFMVEVLAQIRELCFSIPTLLLFMLFMLGINVWIWIGEDR